MLSSCLILFCFTADDIVREDLMYSRTWFSSQYLAIVPSSNVNDKNSSPTFSMDDGGADDDESGSIERMMEREGMGWG